MECCILCLELNLQDNIKIDSKRWLELEVGQVLEKHFWQMTNIQQSSGICLSCWHEVNQFHTFYIRIEKVHLKINSIKVEKEIMYSPKVENENLQYSCLEPEILIDQSALQALSEEDETCDKSKTSFKDLGYNNKLNQDPLIKLSNTKVKSSPKSKTKKTWDKAKVNLKPNANDKIEQTDTDTEEDDDEEDNESLQSLKNKANLMFSEERRKKHENDNFLAEHFKEMFCDICEIRLDNFSSIQKHFKSVHKQMGYVICCDKKFYKRHYLVDHLNSHLNPLHYKCTLCSKIMANRRCLKQHMRRVHYPNEMMLTHVCELCDKAFATASLLGKHKLTHLTEEEKKFPCEECGKFYASNNLLNHHNQVVHLKKFVKICYICGKSIANGAVYKKHMDQHKGVPAPLLNCDICGLRLTTESILKRHKDTQHPIGGKQDHPCSMCSKISPTLRALRKHIDTVHKKSSEHKCTICEKMFKRAETLREHMATHTGTTLYTCPWCPKTFNSNGNMHAHRKKMHYKEWEQAKLQKYSKILPADINMENS